MKELNQKLAIVQTKLKTKKTSYNAFGKYYFRKAEDILEAVKPFLLEQGITVTINEELISESLVPTIKSTATITDGKDAIHATAIVGVDLNQKGMQTAPSYGKKYALGNLFLIDDTADSDATNDHGKKASVVNKIRQAAKTNITDTQMKDAVKYIKAGGNIEAIKNKYLLTSVQEKQLNGQTTSTQKTL